jgi:arylsulfatase A-like enzyme
MTLRFLIVALFTAMLTAGTAKETRPNILWIIAEDASPHIGPYGENLIATPSLDRLAREGVTFANAFTTAPVCSPSRTALIAGMSQTTLGSHNHESNHASREIGGDPVYYASYVVPKEVKLIPELFAEAGYYVVNGGTAKTHYNFVARTELYAGTDWSTRASGQPFFAQIQLKGGKGGDAAVSDPVDSKRVTLPPHLPDSDVLRKEWAKYLDDWKATDREVGEILSRLEREGLLESTVIFFLTDHGISHVRAKQFLYEDGLKIPLLMRLPGQAKAGMRREDLVCHLDIAATSLELAGIAIPDYVQGQPLLGARHAPRTSVVSARDRCDETVDLIRSIRTERFRYIRNFMSYRAHLQPNQYKDGKAVVRELRRLRADGELTAAQKSFFETPRPVEELYDLHADPDQLVNLASDPSFQSTRAALRDELYATLVAQRDAGMIPEPILDEMGLVAGSKYAALLEPENGGLIREIIATIEAGERRDVDALHAKLGASQAAVRYWAAVWLGQIDDDSAKAILLERLNDESGAVRVAAAEALYRLGKHDLALAELKRALADRNHNTAFYAVRAWADISAPADALRAAVRASPHASYDYIKRVMRRIKNR